MRKLTLQEKISIKGILSKRGVTYPNLARIDMKSAVHFWYTCVPGPISTYYKYK